MSLQAVVELVDKMSGPLRGLTGLLGEFSKGVVDGAKAELELQKSGNEAAKGQHNLASSLKDVGKALLGLAAAKQIMDAFGRSMTAADQMDELSGKTGIAADKLQGYAFAAAQSDTSLEGMIQGLNKLNRSLAMSEEETSKQAAAFEALDIKVTNVDGSLKSSEQTFGEVADKFKDLKDGPEKAALAFAIFGQSGKDLIPMLNRGSAEIAALREESLQLGQMGTGAFNAYTDSAGKMFDGLNRVQSMFEGLVNVISAEVVPIFNVLIQSFVESFKSGGMVAQIFEAIKVVAIGALVPAMKIVIQVFRGFADVVEIAGKSLGALGAIIAAVASGDIEGAKGIWAAYKEDVAKTADEHVKFTDKLWDASNAADQVGKALEATGNKAKTAAPKIKKIGDTAKEVKSDLEAMVSALKIANESFGKDESEKQKLEAKSKYDKDIKAGVNPAKAQALLVEANAQIELNKTKRDGATAEDLYKKAKSSIADDELKVAILEKEASMIGASKSERDKAIQNLIDEAEIRKITNGLTGESSAALTKEIKDLQARRNAAKGMITDSERLNSLMSGTYAEQSKKALEDVAFLWEQFQAGKIKSEAEYVEAVQLRLSQLKDNNKVAADEITIFWQEAAKNMQSTMGSFFFDIMQGNITDLGGRFKQMLDRMVADALAANLADAVFGKGFGKTGNLGGWAAQGMAFLGSMFGGARAEGGPVTAGKVHLVGERGPEMFVPKVSGMIVPNSALSQTQQAGAQVNVNITAMDSQDVRRALERDNRWLADLVNKSSRAYNLGI